MQCLSVFRLWDGVFGVLAIAAIAIAPPAAADPIVVTDGFIQIDSSNPSRFGFEADGLSLYATVGFPFSELGPLRDCFLTPCTPGMTFDSSAHITHNPLNSTDYLPGVGLNGVFYTSAVVDGYIFINGPSGVIPSLTDGEPTNAAIIGGMVLDAVLTVYADASRSGTPLLSTQLSGRGWLGTRWGEGFTGGSVRPWDLTYRFASEPPPAPVPESGTLFLVAAGAACVLKRRV